MGIRIQGANPQSTATAVKNGVAQVEDKMGFLGQFAGMTRKAVAFANAVEKIAKDIMRGFDQLQVIAVVNGLFEVPKFISKVEDVVTKEGAKAKLVAVSEAAMSASRLAESASGAAKYIQSFGTIAKEAVSSWTGPLGLALLPFQTVATVQDAYSLGQHGTSMHEVYKLKKPKFEDTVLQRASNVAAGLTKLSSMDAKEFQEHYNVDAKDSVQEKLAKLASNIESTTGQARLEAIEKGEKVMEEMKSRINRTVALKAASTATKTVGLVSALVAIFVPPVAIIAASIGLVSGAIGLGCYLYKRYGMSKKVASLSEIE